MSRGKVKGYSVFEKLGSGSFASVFKACQDRTGIWYAMKIVDKAILVPKQEEYLTNEISHMLTLNHPNIVRLKEYLCGPKHVYIVLELCELDLDSFIKHRSNSGIDERVALSFLRQLADGLQYLNSKDLIHRDLKPANVLLTEPTEYATLKLADFGFIKSLSESAALAQTDCGTPLYKAPEIWRREPYDSKVDVWSVGCIFYKMRYGCTPFTGRDERELLQNIMKKKLPVDASDSMLSRNLLAKTLEIQPQKRFSVADLFDVTRQIVPIESPRNSMNQGNAPCLPSPVPPMNAVSDGRTEIPSTSSGNCDSTRVVNNVVPPICTTNTSPAAVSCLPVDTPTSAASLPAPRTTDSAPAASIDVVSDSKPIESVAAPAVAADEDFVIIEEGLNGLYSISPRQVDEAGQWVDQQPCQTCQNEVESQEDEDESRYLKSLNQQFQLLGGILVAIVKLADRLVSSALLNSKGRATARARTNLLKATSLYLHALRLLQSRMEQMKSSSKYATCENKQAANDVERNMLVLFDDLMQRMTHCQEKLASMFVIPQLDQLPAENFMYQSATEMAREGSVQERLGNLAKACELYSVADLLIEGISLTAREPVDKQTLMEFSSAFRECRQICAERSKLLGIVIPAQRSAYLHQSPSIQTQGS